jgi:DNA invertase Pin-like site-specific DNA recombinase
MIAAIYARKSTDQSGVAPDQKSIARQLDHARQYAARNGWHVDEDGVFIDDGISGAEFSKRPGFMRLMNALHPRPPFQVLVIMDESRLGREQIETAYALKQLTRAGVRVFCYLSDRERTLDTPVEKAMLALETMSDEMERDKARQRTHDAMRRKFEQGHVTGGQCFGYRNVDVTTPGPDGRPKRQYVRREIHTEEAAIVRRIFERCAAGDGLKAITKRLNAEGVLAPRAQRGRPRAWAPSSVRAILTREVYRGVVVWNKTRKRDADGQKRTADRSADQWMRRTDDALRIVSDQLWTAVMGG